MTSVTLKTFHEVPIASAFVLVAGSPDSEPFWNAATYMISQSPRLAESGIMGYSYVAPEYPYNGSIVGGYFGALNMPNGTLAELGNATMYLQKHLGSMPGVQVTIVPTEYPSLFAWYEQNRNLQPVGSNNAIGNRLLDGPALSNVTALRSAIIKATPRGTITSLNQIAGPGLWSAKPAGGSNSVTPAWRKAYVEYGTDVLPLLLHALGLT